MLRTKIQRLRRGRETGGFGHRAGSWRVLAAAAIVCALSMTPTFAQHGGPGGGGFHGGGFGGGEGFRGGEGFGGGDFRGGGGFGDFHGRDFASFGPGELRAWRGGLWRHDWYDGRFGWWWIVGDGWYFYPEPIWPYPTYVAPAFVAQQPPPVVAGVPPAQFWYFCDNPRGYYPNVATCSVPWRSVPVTAPR